MADAWELLRQHHDRVDDRAELEYDMTAAQALMHRVRIRWYGLPTALRYLRARKDRICYTYHNDGLPATALPEDEWGI